MHSVIDSKGELITTFITKKAGSGDECIGAQNGVVYGINIIRVSGELEEDQSVN